MLANFDIPLLIMAKVKNSEGMDDEFLGQRGASQIVTRFFPCSKMWDEIPRNSPRVRNLPMPPTISTAGFSAAMTDGWIGASGAKNG